MNYTCIGFDIRVWPNGGDYSSESSIWEQEPFVYEEIKKKFNLKENFYQILEIENQKTFEDVHEFISCKDNAVLIALCIPTSIANIFNGKYGHPNGYSIDLSKLKTLGVDIGDVNGFFSILQNPDVENLRKSKNLFLEHDFSKILEVLQFAGFADKYHSPYCTIRILASNNVKF